jgi:hypothetical protein
MFKASANVTSRRTKVQIPNSDKINLEWRVKNQLLEPPARNHKHGYPTPMDLPGKCCHPNHLHSDVKMTAAMHFQKA